MIRYPIGASGQAIVLTRDVIGYLRERRQRKLWDTEAGGQLFARLENDDVVIVEATGPRDTDVCKPWSYRPDPIAEQAEIDARYKLGLMFVGDWHTHLQSRPEPSGRDVVNINQIFRRSRHQVAAFVMLIVGKAPAPRGLYLAVADGDHVHRLRAA